MTEARVPSPHSESTGRQVASNSAWNAAQQLATVTGGTLFSLVLAFFLPVAEYGRYSYALALCSVGTSIAAAGLHGLGVRLLVEQSERSGRLLATMMLVREMFALGAVLVLVGVSLTSGDPSVVLVSAVMLLTLFARAGDTPELWYLARLRSSSPAQVRIATTLVFLAARAIALLALPNLWVFVALYVVEAFAASTAIFVRYRLDRESYPLQLGSRKDVGSIARSSAPLALSSIANQVNLKADIVIVQALLGASAVGVYSVAARVGELAYFLPVVIMNSTLPLLVNARRNRDDTGDARAYNGLLQRSYDRAFIAGLLIAVLTCAAVLILQQLRLGPNFAQSVEILSIYIWTCPFVFMGAVYSKWIIAENYLWASFFRHAAGGVLNVILTIALVRELGLPGAAIATVAAYSFANYFVCFLGNRSRPQGIMMTLAFAAPVTYTWRTLRRLGASNGGRRGARHDR